jgi:hypothetical protein
VPKPPPASIAGALTVPERLLLFYLASDTDWQAASITQATAQHMMVRGLIERGSRLFPYRDGAMLQAHQGFDNAPPHFRMIRGRRLMAMRRVLQINLPPTHQDSS